MRAYYDLNSGAKVSISKKSDTSWKLIVEEDGPVVYWTRIKGGDDGWVIIQTENTDGYTTIDQEIVIHIAEIPPLIKALYKIYCDAEELDKPVIVGST